MKRTIPIFVLCILLFCSPLAHAVKEPLRNGEDSARVVALQTRLAALGYFPYRATGSFGTLTQNAVMAFQRANSLPEDGEAGEETLSALFMADASALPFSPRITLTYTAPQGALALSGDAVPWDSVRRGLVAGEEILVTHAHYKTSCTLVLTSAEGGHAHLQPQLDADIQMLNQWLGDSNSFYKCAVVAKVPSWQGNIAAALQWNGVDRVCLYLHGSSSDVLALPDAEAEQLIASCTKQ